jgi:hypothetical protein
MPFFTPIEIVDGIWMNGKIRPMTISTRDPNTGVTTETTEVIFNADLKDVQDFTVTQIDEYILELQNIQAKMNEMELEINPPIPIP